MWCEELTHWKRPWCWERLKAGGEGDGRGWDGWMASPTWWTWVWVNPGRRWWAGRPGMLWFMGLQRVGHDWVTELNWTETCTDKEGFLQSASYHHSFTILFCERSVKVHEEKPLREHNFLWIYITQNLPALALTQNSPFSNFQIAISRLYIVTLLI